MYGIRQALQQESEYQWQLTSYQTEKKYSHILYEQTFLAIQ